MPSQNTWPISLLISSVLRHTKSDTAIGPKYCLLVARALANATFASAVRSCAHNMAWAELTQRHHTTLNNGKEHVALGQPICDPTPASHGLALVPVELVVKGVARIGMFIKRTLAKDVLDACIKEGERSTVCPSMRVGSIA